MKQKQHYPVLVPVLITTVVMALSKIIYNLPWLELAPSIHQPAVNISGALLFVSLVFGPSLVYPMARFRGASISHSFVACLIAPLIWDIWEIIRVTEFFTPAVSLYYGLNSLFLGACIFAVFQAAIWESIYRRRLAKTAKGRGLKAPAGVALASLVIMYFMLFWGLGAHWFYLYGNIYKALFH